MSEEPSRRREVRSEYNAAIWWYHCDVHDWSYEESNPEDVCPVCLGESSERERIIALLETLKCKCDDDCDMVESPFHILIPFLKGEVDA